MGQLLAGTDVSYEVNGTRVIMFHAVTPQKEQEKAFVLKKAESLILQVKGDWGQM